MSEGERGPQRRDAERRAERRSDDLATAPTMVGDAAKAGAPRIDRPSLDHRDRAPMLSGSQDSVGFSDLPSPPTEGSPDPAERDRVFEALFQVPAPEQTLGRYVVLGTLGQGGMGMVLEAFDRTLDRKVAVKVLLEDLDEQHTARLLREAQALAKLSHPNVVQVYEADTIGGKTFVAMELVKGQTLKDWMKQEPRPDWRQAVEVFIQLGQGLAAAHAEGLIHRDFKPGNAILDDKGRPRVLDFGLARRAPTDPDALSEQSDDGLAAQTLDSDPFPEPATPRRPRNETLDEALTLTGTVLGTPAYMPPEQMGGQEADARSDQFSFCVSLWEAVYSERPFEGTSMMALMLSMREGTVRESAKGTGVPAALRQILLRGLAVDPDERWPSMDALLEQLQALVAPRARRWIVGGLAVLTVAAGITSAGFYRQAEESAEGERSALELAEERRWEAEHRRAEAEYSLSVQRSVMARMLIPDDREGEALSLAVQAVTAYGPDFDRTPPEEVVDGLEHVLADDALVVRDAVACSGHAARIEAIAWTPDGSRLVTASEDGSARLWDGADGASITTLVGHQGKVYDVDVSDDGSRVATTSRDGTAKIWDARTGTLMLTLEGHLQRLTSIDISPDGSRVVTGSADRSARVWDLRTGASLLTLHDDDVVGTVSFSPDGSRVATSGLADTAKIWDATTGARLGTLAGHRSGTFVFAHAFSPDGARLATAGTDMTARIWDARSGEPLSTLVGHANALMDVEFSPDGSRVATTSTDKTAKLWDAREGELLATLAGNDYGVVMVEFSPDGTQIATAGGDGTAQLWDADGRHRATLIGHGDVLTGLAYSPDGTRVATSSVDGTARIWSTAVHNPIATHRGHGDVVWDAAWSPDGQRIATGSKDKTIRIWDVNTGAQQLVLASHRHTVMDLAFSPDGTRLASVSLDRTATLWDAGSGAALSTIDGDRQLTTLAFSPDGARLVTAGYDSTVRAWDAKTGTLSQTFEGHPRGVTHLRFSSDGDRLFTAGADMTARSWEPASGEPRVVFSGHEAPISAMDLAPSADRLATADAEGTVFVWDAETGTRLHRLAAGAGRISTLTHSPDGAHLAAASKDGNIYLWNAETGEAREPLTTGAQPVDALAFVGDGANLVSGTGDGRVQVWSFADGTLLRTMDDHHAPITMLVPSPDGTRFTTTSMDNTARVWDPGSGSPLADLSDHIGMRQDDGTIRWPVAPSGLARIACARLRSVFPEEYAQIAERCDPLLPSG